MRSFLPKMSSIGVMSYGAGHSYKEGFNADELDEKFKITFQGFFNPIGFDTSLEQDLIYLNYGEKMEYLIEFPKKKYIMYVRSIVTERKSFSSAAYILQNPEILKELKIDPYTFFQVALTILNEDKWGFLKNKIITTDEMQKIVKTIKKLTVSPLASFENETHCFTEKENVLLRNLAVAIVDRYFVKNKGLIIITGSKKVAALAPLLSSIFYKLFGYNSLINICTKFWLFMQTNLLNIAVLPSMKNENMNSKINCIKLSDYTTKSKIATDFRNLIQTLNLNVTELFDFLETLFKLLEDNPKLKITKVLAEPPKDLYVKF